MKATVHSVLFLCALCVLIWGGVSIAAQDGKPVVEKAKAARTAVDAAKGLGEKVKEANENFTKNSTDFDTLFTDALNGVPAAVNKAEQIITGTPNKDDAKAKINGLTAKINEAHNAAKKLKNAEAASLKDPENAEIGKNLQAVEDRMKQAEDAANAVTDDDTSSIDDVVQKAEELKKVAGEAVAFWTKIEKGVKSQVDAANSAVEQIDAAIKEVTESIEYVGKNSDSNAGEAKTGLETAVKAKLDAALEKAKAIQTASLEAQTNVKALVERYGTVQTEAGSLEQAARDNKKPTGS